MNPQIEAALITAIVSLISFGGTVVVALSSFRASVSETHRQRGEDERLMAHRQGL